jgi:flagellar export protein FliJ
VQRFQFRLQRVLQWQQRVCRIEEDTLRVFMAAAAETDDKLERLAAEALAIERDVSTRTAWAGADLRALAAFRRSVSSTRQQLEIERRARLANVDAQRQKLLTERRRLHIFEKLRDRALAEHTRATDRELEAIGLESYLSTWVSGMRR